MYDFYIGVQAGLAVAFLVALAWTVTGLWLRRRMLADLRDLNAGWQRYAKLQQEMLRGENLKLYANNLELWRGWTKTYDKMKQLEAKGNKTSALLSPRPAPKAQA